MKLSMMINYSGDFHADVKKVVELEKKYCPSYKRVENDLQTNGTLLDDETAARNAGAGLWALPESDIAAPWLARTGRSVRDGATATGAGGSNP